MHIRFVLAAVAVAGAFALPAAASSGDYTIKSDTKIGRLALRGATIADMKAAFGRPSSMQKAGPLGCSISWRKRGLTIQLLNLDRVGNPCVKGGFVAATMLSPKWRTDRGLRVGDSRGRLQKLYPKAKQRRPNAWWLVTRKACAAVGGPSYGGLVATVRLKRVVGLAVITPPCD